MSPEQQRIAIAEACGWKNQKYSERSPQAMWCNPDGVPIGFLPDYLSDLNAMHEAEKALTPRQREIYAECLSSDCGDVEYELKNPDSYIGYIEYPADITFKFIHATAAQRAEAFLRTIGKWTSPVPDASATPSGNEEKKNTNSLLTQQIRRKR